MNGTLYLVPNLLGAVPPENVLPKRTLDIARALTHWVVETPKAARAYFKSIDIAVPVATLDIRALPSGTVAADHASLLAPAHAGHAIGLLSDAGCPGVADPGALLVAAAHQAGITVVPLVGPSAILLALMASGMNGQGFVFHGYLPVKSEARAAALRMLESASRKDRTTQLFIETPYRNVAMLEAAASVLTPSTIVCVAADLTLPSETIERRSAAAWRRQDLQRFDRRPALFAVCA